MLASVLLLLGGCATNPNASSLEQNLAADPQLANSSGLFGDRNAQLPPDFPQSIPRYPNAALINVEQSPTPAEGNTLVTTRWQSSDASDRVVRFYQEALTTNNWQITARPSDDRQGTFQVQQGDLALTVEITPTAPANLASTPSPGTAQTQLTIQYAIAGQDGQSSALTNTSIQGQVLDDLAQAPSPLQPYIRSLAELGVFQVNGTVFQPNQPVTRRVFARWMITTYNQFYRDRPALQVRSSTTTVTPIFKDVPPSDPDFGLIQGAAEAGLLPSPRSGDATATQFRPDAPLTRETMVQWKVPLDIRKALPTASVDNIKEVWGFQDAARINPKALKAVLADYQNGELSNISRTFGYTTLFQPQRAVTRAEAAACLWYFGYQGDGISADDALRGQTNPSSPQPDLMPGTTTPTPTPTNALTPGLR